MGCGAASTLPSLERCGVFRAVDSGVVRPLGCGEFVDLLQAVWWYRCTGWAFDSLGEDPARCAMFALCEVDLVLFVLVEDLEGAR